VVSQVMESGPITKGCQYIHQKFKTHSIVSGFADTAGVAWWFDGRFVLARFAVRILVVPSCTFPCIHLLLMNLSKILKT